MADVLRPAGPGETYTCGPGAPVFPGWPENETGFCVPIDEAAANRIREWPEQVPVIGNAVHPITGEKMLFLVYSRNPPEKTNG